METLLHELVKLSAYFFQENNSKQKSRVFYFHQKSQPIFYPVKNLNIPNYENCNSLAENIADPTLKAIAKWKNHPSIPAISSEYKNRANFSFKFVSKEDVLTEIKVLDFSKAIQESDIVVKIIKANDNFFAETICVYLN